MLLNYSRELKFEEKPDYLYLKKMINTMAEEANIELDNCFDWTNKSDQKIPSTNNERKDSSNIPNESTKISSSKKK